MTGRWRLSAAGMALLALTVLGAVALAVGSRTVQIVGFVAVVAGVGGLSFGALPNRLGSMLTIFEVRGRSTPGGLSAVSPPDPEPEYIADAPEAPESAWEHERELYLEKDRGSDSD